MTTLEDFLSWKKDPSTKAFFLLLARRKELIKEHLALVAGENPLEDRKQVGCVSQIDDILAISYDDLKEVE